MQNQNRTEVIFKKTKDNEVIAFFPYETANRGRMLSYMHIGQHSEADYGYYLECKKANEQEYKNLYDELNRIGYDDLKVIQRVNYDRFLSKQ
jgi:hypothetical protein